MGSRFANPYAGCGATLQDVGTQKYAHARGLLRIEVCIRCIALYMTNHAKPRQGYGYSEDYEDDMILQLFSTIPRSDRNTKWCQNNGKNRVEENISTIPPRDGPMLLSYALRLFQK